MHGDVRAVILAFTYPMKFCALPVPIEIGFVESCRNEPRRVVPELSANRERQQHAINRWTTDDKESMVAGGCGLPEIHRGIAAATI